VESSYCSFDRSRDHFLRRKQRRNINLKFNQGSTVRCDRGSTLGVFDILDRRQELAVLPKMQGSRPSFHFATAVAVFERAGGLSRLVQRAKAQMAEYKRLGQGLRLVSPRGLAEK
jgi:hypothetical protein